MKPIIVLTLTSLIVLFSCSDSAEEETPSDMTDQGTMVVHEDFQSAFVPSRQVEVWLPPGYDENEQKSYAVLYMHDGQNVFNPETSFTGVAWEADKSILRQIERNTAEPAIVVAVWNTPNRLGEYMPQQPVLESERLSEFEALTEQKLVSDDYLRFLVEELKPFIDATYRTQPQAESTYIMGSSMGGLISLYAIARYPDVFSAAGCLSTHWPIAEGMLVDWFAEHLPEPGNHRIYFDFGTEGLDAEYEVFQNRMDSLLVARGFREGLDFVTLKFNGHDHNETYWRQRLDLPVEVLLAGDQNR